MKLQMVGCSHHNATSDARARLAFSAEQACDALERWRRQFPATEAVLLSTCNRVEVYTAALEPEEMPGHEDVAAFLAGCHGLELDQVFDDLFERTGEDAVRHLFAVAASLDSMVVGEPQIVSQVKQAYELACQQQSTGPLTNAVFQAALKVAKRVATETSINEKRVSIASVAVADFARRIFERFDDKCVLVIGAGEMAEETLRHLQQEGARRVSVVNRSFARAEELSQRWQGRAEPWDQLSRLLIEADLVVSTTGAAEPIVTLANFQSIAAARAQRPVLIIDLAMPRDFEPAIGQCLGVYLYCLDDLRQACERNREERNRERPAAERIVQEETSRFMSELYTRATGPTITRLKQSCQTLREEELRRLFNRLSHLDDRAREEIANSFDRLINKLLHPPLESLRHESQHGVPHVLLDALRRLFQLKD